MREGRCCDCVNFPRTRLSGSWLSWPTLAKVKSGLVPTFHWWEEKLAASFGWYSYHWCCFKQNWLITLKGHWDSWLFSRYFFSFNFPLLVNTLSLQWRSLRERRVFLQNRHGRTCQDVSDFYLESSYIWLWMIWEELPDLNNLCTCLGFSCKVFVWIWHKHVKLQKTAQYPAHFHEEKLPALLKTPGIGP